MKNLYTIILFFFLFSVNAQNYYYNGSEKVEIYQSEKSFILFEDTEQKTYKGFEKAERYLEKGFIILKNKKSDFSIKESFKNKSQLISPAFKLEKDGAFEMFPTKAVRVKLLSNKSKNDISNLLNDNNIFQIEEKYGIIRIHVNNINEVFDIANKIYESGIAEFSLPDFYIEKKVNQINDPLFPLQYQMNNTGQVVDGITGVNDIDSNALEAWNINLGDNITVAIIDDGLEAHEDIGNRFLGGFTPLNNGNGQPVTNGATHGMNCAGVLAASDNNLGVRGVAPNASLLSVNIFAGGETVGDIADGIVWAANNGADIISNSWSFNNVPCGFTNAVVDAAIQDAVTSGRNGRGCVVVFSSGNDLTFAGGCVDYPATNPNVVSVGAIDNRGNLYGYSRRGPELDLVAPSGLSFFRPGELSIGVRTLDRMGVAGNNNGNYRDDFDGTSAACPVVSGAAALVLSVNPNLTQQEVRNILINTATDMGANGFDNNFGNGRVNTFVAVQAALPPPKITGDVIICSTGTETYTLSYLGSSVNWQKSSNLQIISSSSTHITVKPISTSVNEAGFVRANTASGSTQKTIWIGKPIVSPPPLPGPGPSPSTTFCQSYNYLTQNYVIVDTEGVPSPSSNSDWEWVAISNNFYYYTYKNRINFIPHQVGPLVFKVRAKNKCGWSNYVFFQYEIVNCGSGGGGQQFRVFPNPASNAINIAYSNETTETSENRAVSKPITQIRLYDFSGNLLMQKNNGSFEELNVSRIKKGLYFLEIFSDNTKEIHRIVIEK